MIFKQPQALMQSLRHCLHEYMPEPLFRITMAVSSSVKAPLARFSAMYSAKASGPPLLSARTRAARPRGEAEGVTDGEVYGEDCSGDGCSWLGASAERGAFDAGDRTDCE